MFLKKSLDTQSKIRNVVISSLYLLLICEKYIKRTKLFEESVQVKKNTSSIYKT